jgi:LDH2 family malate/lactate/ureidoglycolate dehydrogenase
MREKEEANMPLIDAGRLEVLVEAIFRAAGTSAAEAATVARHMVGANVAGHDSHGIQLLPGYVVSIRHGHTVPGAPIEVLDETATTARVDGHWGLGQVVSERAMGLAMEKAQRGNVAAITVVQQAHVGRLADYPLMAARAGLIGFMFCDSGKTAKPVVPFGGREARLGTNPLCIALPSDLEAPVFIDMATSAAAANKIAIYRKRGQALPEGWIVDRDGRPSTDPADYASGGSLLPFGGAQGHKGYGLGFMIEVFTGLLTGLGFGIDPSGRHNDAALLLALNPAAFRPAEAFRQEVAAFARYIKQTPPAPGVPEVFYPGELEWQTEQSRRRDGIPVDDETWTAVTTVAQECGATDLADAAVLSPTA